MRIYHILCAARRFEKFIFFLLLLKKPFNTCLKLFYGSVTKTQMFFVSWRLYDFVVHLQLIFSWSSCQSCIDANKRLVQNFLNGRLCIISSSPQYVCYHFKGANIPIFVMQTVTDAKVFIIAFVASDKLSATKRPN